MSKSTDILFIDDEQVILDFGVKIASFMDYTVDTALEAETAIEKLKKNKYKLIISDIRLPGIDGISFLEILRRKEIRTPVIMSTGYSTFENAVLSLNKGALDFIPKPFTADELISAISRGFRFIEITCSGDDNNISPENDYVPCPSRYRQLGFYSWISKSDEGTYLVGVTDIFMKIISEFNNLELRNIGEELEQGKTMIKFVKDESVYHDVLAPLSGKIVEVNKKTVNEKNLIFKDPFFEGWVYKIIPSALQKEEVYLSGSSEY